MTGGAWLEALHFLRPQWLWGLLALPLLGWAWRRRHAARNPWRGVIDPHLLPHLLEDAPHARARSLLPLLGALLAAALALLALAGPSWQRSEQPLWQVRTPLMIALDLSGSMLASDLPPSRLAQARAKLATLLAQRVGGQVGLLVYAEDAYVIAPLTGDAANVALFLEALSPQIMPGEADVESRADRAIEQARQRLQQAGFDQGDILLLDHHADDQAIEAARTAAADGYRVSVLGLGTPEGAPWRDGSGGIHQSRLDAASLQALAAAGRGRYDALSADASDLKALGVLDPRQAGASAADGKQAMLWRDQGYWLLLPLLLLVAIAFRRGSVFALLAACMLLPWQPAHAADAEDWWRRPDQQAHARMEAGAQAYQQGAFDEALGQWQGLAGADAAYNRGNALARLGQYQEAIAAYDEALRLHPGMADAIANRKAVEAAMKRPPSGGGKQDKPSGKPDDSGGQQGEPQGGGEGDGKPQPGQQAPGQQQPDARDGKPQAGQESGQGQPGARAKPDAAEQEAADAAQRTRMQQALQRQQGAAAEDKAKAGAPAETAQQREQRLASEAWLRRVPDDPGGLLRARLLLEYERRREQGK